VRLATGGPIEAGEWHLAGCPVAWTLEPASLVKAASWLAGGRAGGVDWSGVDGARLKVAPSFRQPKETPLLTKPVVCLRQNGWLSCHPEPRRESKSGTSSNDNNNENDNIADQNDADDKCCPSTGTTGCWLRVVTLSCVFV